MSEPRDKSLHVARPRGRPRAIMPRTSVSTWLPERTADRLIQIANRNGVSVSSVVRQIVILRLSGEAE